MNGKDIIQAMNNIDDKYISEFADTSRFRKKNKFYLMPRFYGSVAALLVIGISIFIAMNKNDPPIDIVQENNNAVSEITKNNDTPRKNDSEMTSHPVYQNELNTTDDIADTAENAVNKGNDFEEDNIFSIKVYAAEVPLELNLYETVQIKGDFNPIMSSSRGIGIEFEITPSERGLTLQTDNGYFVTWDKDSGAITNHSSEYFIDEKSDIFWTTQSSENSVINILNQNAVISVINISYDENTNTFSAQRTQ